MNQEHLYLIAIVAIIVLVVTSYKQNSREKFIIDPVYQPRMMTRKMYQPRFYSQMIRPPNPYIIDPVY